MELAYEIHPVCPISADYARWRLRGRITRLIDLQMPGAPRYKIRAAVERYYISKACEASWERPRPLLLGPAEAKLWGELHGLERSGAQTATKAWRLVWAAVVQAYTGLSPDEVRRAAGSLVARPPRCGPSLARVGDFSQSPAEVPLARLHKVGGPEKTLRVLLRYGSVGLSTRALGIPFAGAEKLRTEFGFTVETFASPIDARFLGKPGAAFYSPFYDTDAPFGSLGSFFGANGVPPSPPPPGGWVCTPPHVENFLDRAVRAVLGAAEKTAGAGFRAIFVAPHWEDADFYARMRASPYVVATTKTTPKTFWYEDPLGRQRSGVRSIIWGVASDPQEATLLAEAIRALVASGAPRGSPRRR